MKENIRFITAEHLDTVIANALTADPCRGEGGEEPAVPVLPMPYKAGAPVVTQ